VSGSRFEVRIVFTGWESRRGSELASFVGRHADWSNLGAGKMSRGDERPYLPAVEFVATRPPESWHSWLTRLVESARYVTGTACTARLLVTEVSSTAHEPIVVASAIEERSGDGHQLLMAGS
jgi:hypothetical protein